MMMMMMMMMICKEDESSLFFISLSSSFSLSSRVWRSRTTHSPTTLPQF
jgi:hypothetical protein